MPRTAKAPAPVKPEQRFTADRPCPVCGGHKDAPTHSGLRCWGFLGDDGRTVICTEIESDREAGESSGWFHDVDEDSASSSPVQTSPSRGEVEAKYTYVNEAGIPLFEVLRLSGKRFAQRRPHTQGFGIQGVRLVPYRLPEIVAAVASGKRIYVVEGEKDVHAIEQAGEVATCNPMGAGKWRDEYSRFLTDADVIVVADNDDGAGIKHARDVRRSLLGIARSVKIVRAASGKDSHDHIEAGHTLDAFEPVAVRFERMLLGSYVPTPPRWLFEPVLLAETYTLIPAAAGAGKTMIALAMMS